MNTPTRVTLSPDQVEEIKHLYKTTKMTLKAIGHKYGISYRIVQWHVRGITERPRLRRAKRSTRPMAQAPFEHCRLYIAKRKNEFYVRLVPLDGGDPLYMSRARYLMSVKLGRVLSPDEQVRRIEGPSDELENLYITNWAEKSKRTTQKNTVPCETCTKPFVKRRSAQRFCSKPCRGIWSRTLYSAPS